MRPGTLARILVHAGLSERAAGAGNIDARAALERLVHCSDASRPVDAVAAVAEAQVALALAPDR